MNLITIGVIDLYLNLITSYISLNNRLFKVLKAVKLCWYFKSFYIKHVFMKILSYSDYPLLLFGQSGWVFSYRRSTDSVIFLELLHFIKVMFEQIESLVSLLEESVNFIKLLKVNLELITGLFVVSHEFFVILSVLNMSLLHILCIAMINMP